MTLRANIHNCQRRFLPALAVLAASAAMAQDIVYVHLPPSNAGGATNALPWDALGTQVGPDLAIVINGQTVCTFAAPLADGQPSDVVIEPNATSAVIALQPNLANNPLDPTAFPIALTNGTQIGPDAAGYGWLGSILGGDVLTVSRDGGIVGEGAVTEGYFTGDASAYIGLEFEQDGDTYYGWIRAGCPVAGLNVGWVYDYAYETVPGKPILAGEKPVYFEATCNGGNEVPPNRSGHSGSGTFVLEGNVLSFNVTLDGAFAPESAGLFGPAMPAIDGPRIASLGSCMISNLSPVPFPSPVIGTDNLGRPPVVLPPPYELVYSGQITLTKRQVTYLMDGALYVNVASAHFRYGELRGEILPTAPVAFSATLDGRNEIPRNASQHHGEAAFTISGSTLSYQLALDNFAIKSAGIYDMPFACPVPCKLIATLDTTIGVAIPSGGITNAPGSPGQILYSGTVNLTDEQVYRLGRNEFYINVLTPRYRSGEISGQILPPD